MRTWPCAALIAVSLCACSGRNDVACWPAASGPPPGGSPAEQLGVVGQCCASSLDCLHNSACVADRCCIALRDTGRGCTVDTDCCSGHCQADGLCEPYQAPLDAPP